MGSTKTRSRYMQGAFGLFKKIIIIIRFPVLTLRRWRLFHVDNTKPENERYREKRRFKTTASYTLHMLTR